MAVSIGILKGMRVQVLPTSVVVAPATTDDDARSLAPPPASRWPRLVATVKLEASLVLKGALGFEIAIANKLGIDD